MSRAARFLRSFFGGLAKLIVLGIMADGPNRLDRILGIPVAIGLAGLIAYLWITRAL
jgi:hypothetical protein